jgi:hypothetical protein
MNGHRIPCRITWCTALPEAESTLCAVHRAHHGIDRPLELEPGEGFTYVRVIGTKAYDDFDDCQTCGGDGKCIECEGSGDHTCECGDEHECHACDGSGDCQDCDGASGRHDITNIYDHRSRACLLNPLWAKTVSVDERKQAERYLRAVYLPVWEAR